MNHVLAKIGRTGAMLAILGQRGTGKTQMAVEAVIDTCIGMADGQARTRTIHFNKDEDIDDEISRYSETEPGRDTPAVYVKSMEIFHRLRAAFRDDGPSEAEVVRPFTTSSLLVIDEIQERGETDYEDRQLTYIMDKRYDAGLDTLVVGNLKASEFAQKLGPSIADRFAQMGGVIELNGKSRRRTTQV